MITLPSPERKKRCRVNGKMGDRCESEAVTDFGFCAHHLVAASEEFRRIVEEHGADGQ